MPTRRRPQSTPVHLEVVFVVDDDGVLGLELVAWSERAQLRGRVISWISGSVGFLLRIWMWCVASVSDILGFRRKDARMPDSRGEAVTSIRMLPSE